MPRPYVVGLEIIMLNAISMLVDQGYTIQEVIYNLGISQDIANRFELVKTYTIEQEDQGAK